MEKYKINELFKIKVKMVVKKNYDIKVNVKYVKKINVKK